MRRNALVVAATLVMIVPMFTGCKSWKKSDSMSTNYPESDWYTTPAQPQNSVNQPASAATDTYRTDAYPTYGTQVETTGTADRVTSASLAATGARYHTVVKKDTLFSLARQYYGDASRWKDIYEANRSKIADPNMIRIGDRLVIP